MGSAQCLCFGAAWGSRAPGVEARNLEENKSLGTYFDGHPWCLGTRKSWVVCLSRPRQEQAHSISGQTTATELDADNNRFWPSTYGCQACEAAGSAQPSPVCRHMLRLPADTRLLGTSTSRALSS